MVSSACGPPPGVARIIGCVGPPTAVSGTAGVGGGGCQAGINVVDSCPSELIGVAMVSATPGTRAAGAGGGGAAGASQGGGTGAGGSATAGSGAAVSAAAAA